MEQWCAVQFCSLSNKSATETWQAVQGAYREELSLSRHSVYDWYRQFENGRQSCMLTPHDGWPSTASTEVNINTIAVIVQEDASLTVREITALVHVSKSTVDNILTKELKLWRVCAQWVPHFLTWEQLQRRVDVCRKWKSKVQRDSGYLNRLITGDESWVYLYNPCTKQETSVWKCNKEPAPKKVRQAKSVLKVMMMITFFDSRDMVYQHAVPAGQTMSAAYYVTIWQKLREHIGWKWREIAQTWILHHDNARPHSANQTSLNFLRNMELSSCHSLLIPQISHLAISLSFSKIESKAAGIQFGSVAEAEKACETFFKSLTSNDYAGGYAAWQSRWDRCLDASGRYFEKELRYVSINRTFSWFSHLLESL